MSTMLSELETRPILSGNEGSFGDEFEKDIGLLLREQQRRRPESDDRDREELNMCRSGSAPPTVEGSLTAVGGLFGQRSAGDSPEIASKRDGNGFVSEEDLRSDPAYLSYYYSNSHLNPRLPPPLVSKEDWRSAQRRLQGGSSSVLGGIGDRRRRVSRPENGGGSRSRASMPPGFDLPREESEPLSDKSGGGGGGGGGAEWDSNGLIGLSGLGLGSRKQSIAEVFQNDLGRATPVSGHPSRPVSRNAFEESTENLASSEAELSHLPLEFTSTEALLPSTNVQGSSLIPDVGQSASYNYASVLGALSRSTTPDPQLVARAPSPCRTPIGGGRAVASEKRSVNSPNSYNGISLGRNESADLSGTFSSLNISANGMVDEEHHLPSQIEQDVDIHQNYFLNLQGAQNHIKRQVEQHRHTVPLGNSPAKRSSMPITNGGRGMHSQYQHADCMNSSYPNYDLSGYTINSPLASVMTNHIGTGNMPPLYENVAAASAMDSKVLGGCLGSGGQNRAAAISESQTLSGMRNQLGGNALQAPFMDPMYLQYMRTAEYAAAQGLTLNDPPVDMNYMGNSYLDLLGLQKAYLGTLMSSQKSQYGVPLSSKSTGSNHLGLYGNPSYGVGISYPGSPLESPGIRNSFVGHGSTIRHNELDMRLPTGMRNLPTQPWHLDGGCNVDENFSSSLLEEFKSNKTNCFELSDIAGHVFEFSADQYGSRFIQQKLETATIEDKNMVFQEIMPHALSLMTDVFGNYVVQKFFEHGATSQIRELANKLIGRVLTLSLQMYGCRVIQKAIEVVDVDQKIKMVEELDSHVMRCVRDQNGNHVIQKSIECVPEESIQFIVTTFFDQVVNLSTHPYGCRVIQRILEHCEDPKTQKKIMDEILGSVSMLAQDQYGNYVIQHVLEHGKSHERSAIIEELAGKIVQMSQQKFASNVVEKCLTFGDPSQREILVNEMLGSTDENEPLQAMMKDQFANYVVQKVLETCEDQHRELILSRIKVHLNALKKYTYGKHIVARVEKLVAAGERRIAAQSSHPS